MRTANIDVVRCISLVSCNPVIMTFLQLALLLFSGIYINVSPHRIYRKLVAVCNVLRRKSYPEIGRVIDSQHVDPNADEAVSLKYCSSYWQSQLTALHLNDSVDKGWNEHLTSGKDTLVTLEGPLP